MNINDKTQGFTSIPKHIAVIMDGNGRWAKKRMMPRSYGHQQGLNRMIGLLDHAYNLGVNYMTMYALSTENLSRPKEELDYLFGLIRKYFSGYFKKICDKGVRLRIIGDKNLLPEDIRVLINKAESDSVKYEKKGLNIALGYGARDEIVNAVNKAIELGEPVTKEKFSSLLYTYEQPDPDLMIRTGDTIRLSNFLLYQSAYTELYFSKKMFPDFSDDDLDEAIIEFGKRVRRFGKTDEQLNK